MQEPKEKIERGKEENPLLTSLIYPAEPGATASLGAGQAVPQPGVTRGTDFALCRGAPSLHLQPLLVLHEHFCTNKPRLIIVLQKPHSEYLIELLLVISTGR